MLKLKYFISAFSLLLSTSIFSQSNVNLGEKYHSDLLQSELQYSIYLPDSYDNTNTYPVLFLLHGIGGDETSWLVRTNVQQIVDSLIRIKALPEAIIIFPDGRNSYYINDYQRNFPFEDILIEELIPYIDSAYPTSVKKEERAIGGISMGGFGATIIPYKHPDIFGTSINISGAVRTPEIFMALPPVKYQNYFGSIFGDSLKGEERITKHWKNNSPYFLTDSSSVQSLSTINWYIDCGMQDFLFPANKALHELFLQFNVNHEYLMRPGIHNWQYWEKAFINSMVYWGDILKANR